MESLNFKDPLFKCTLIFSGGVIPAKDAEPRGFTCMAGPKPKPTLVLVIGGGILHLCLGIMILGITINWQLWLETSVANITH